jgi:hypothetical protein
MKRRFRKKKISIWVDKIEAKVRGPLAYHPRWSGTKTPESIQWVITHVPTGQTFGKKHYESEAQARQYLLLIEGFCKAKKIKLDVDEEALKEHHDTFRTFIAELDKLDEERRKALLTKLTGET